MILVSALKKGLNFTHDELREISLFCFWWIFSVIFYLQIRYLKIYDPTHLLIWQYALATWVQLPTLFEVFSKIMNQKL